MYCKHCGKEVADDARFCSACGKSLADAPDTVETEEPTKKKKKKRHPILGSIVAILGLFIFIGALGSESEPVQPEISKSEYITMCKEIDYETLSRNPDAYKGEYFTFTGEVIQVIENSSRADLRVNVTAKDFYGTVMYSDTIYVNTKLPESGDRILAQDIITIYGVCEGLYTYNAILGTKVSIPRINAAYWEIVK